MRTRQTNVANQRDALITENILIHLANLPSNRNPNTPVFDYQRRDSVYQPWMNAVERASIKKMSPHSCRHGFATAMLHAGVDVKTVAHWGRWKDLRTLKNTYAHAEKRGSLVDEVFGKKLAKTINAFPLTTYNQMRKP